MKTVLYKYSSLTAFLNSSRVADERNSSGKDFYTLLPIKAVDFKLKFVVFLRGTTSLLVSLKPSILLRTTNKYLI